MINLYFMNERSSLIWHPFLHVSEHLGEMFSLFKGNHRQGEFSLNKFEHQMNEYFIYKVDVRGYVLAKDLKIFPASEINKDILSDKYKHLS